ncbi:hypothetical protein BHE74_00015266 [Ensete ventricosum]|nr:hypothetical protein BHE74_00015266 [Ensete ventricosum]
MRQPENAASTKKEPQRFTKRGDGTPGSFSLMLSCDNEKREGVCHEPELMLVLMGRAAAAREGSGATGQRWSSRGRRWRWVRQRCVQGLHVDYLLRALPKGMLCFCQENRGRPAIASAGEPNTLTLFEEAGGDPSQVNV